MTAAATSVRFTQKQGTVKIMVDGDDDAIEANSDGTGAALTPEAAVYFQELQQMFNRAGAAKEKSKMK